MIENYAHILRGSCQYASILYSYSFFSLSFLMVLYSFLSNQAKELQADFVHLSLLSKWVSSSVSFFFLQKMSLVSNALSTTWKILLNK